MSLQVIKDGYGNDTGIFIPITDWNAITQKYQDLKELVNIEAEPRKKLSQLAGFLSNETAEAMRKDVEESRNEWDQRLSNQL
jgi:hypothetical protein